MCISYNDVLKRLIEERNRMALTQKEMGQCIQIDQSNYSKVELGLRRLGYYEVKNLYNVGIDVYYLYTIQLRKILEILKMFSDMCDVSI